ncbi:MAG: zinc ribbon domain-containing protein [Planctomycetes bacterium]|nr:zinc ribbon domain-containing protein [Planctomycetota bacterium]
MQSLACPTCAHAIQVSDELVGRVARCRGCQSRLAIRRDEGGTLALVLAAAPALAPQPRSPAAGHSTSAPCPACGAALQTSDTFCSGCGAPVSAESRMAIEARAAEAERLARRRGARQKVEKSDRTRRVRRAAKVILWLGIMFCLGGLALGFLTKREAEKAREALSESYEPEEVIEIEGEEWVVRDLLAQIDLEVALVFGIHFGLAALMFGLYFWARRAPLPATITALSVYLVVQVGSAIVEPKSLLQGLLFKAIAVAFLIGGIRAALAERAAEAADERRLARERARA